MPIMPGGGQLRWIRQRKGCAQLRLGRGLERLDLHALRIDHADRVPDDATLAGGVHALEHDEDLLGASSEPGPTRGEQPLLQVVELGRSAVGERRARRPWRPGTRSSTAGRAWRGRPDRPAAAAAPSAAARSGRRSRPWTSWSWRPCAIVPYALRSADRLRRSPYASDLRVADQRPQPRELTTPTCSDLYRHPRARGSVAWIRTQLRHVARRFDRRVRTDDRAAINTPSDQHVFALHRAHSDAVLVGAQSAGRGLPGGRPRAVAAGREDTGEPDRLPSARGGHPYPQPRSGDRGER